VRINQFHSVKFHIFFSAAKIKFMRLRLYMHDRHLNQKTIIEDIK